MAEYLLRRRLGPNTTWVVESAGISALNGMRASAAARNVMQESGSDLSRHSSRMLTAEMIRRASVIVVMTATHRDGVIRMAPAAKEKVFMLKSFGGGHGRAEDIDDPVGSSDEIYRQVRDEIDEHMPDLILFLNQYHGE